MQSKLSRSTRPDRKQFVEDPFGPYRLIDTHSVDVAFEAMVRMAHVRSYDLPHGVAGFALRVNYFRFNHIDLTYSANSIEGSIDFDGRPQVRQQIGLSGAATTTLGQTAVVDIGAQSCIIPADAEVKFHYGPRYEQLLLRIDTDAITAKLEALIGSHVRGKLEFGVQADARDPGQQRLRRLIASLDQELAAAKSEPNSLVMAEYEQLIITAFLIANLRNHDRFLQAKPSTIMPWQVRAAEEYIEANWNRSISIEDLSRAVNASARALFKTFKDARGYSPMMFLKRVRLTRAREMLRAGNPRTTITGVALLCGFGNPGHFAADYRRAFGELPSETLQRHK